MKQDAPSFPELPLKKFKSRSPILGRIGNLETRLAHSAQEVRAAQALRYQVFYQELGAKPDAEMRIRKRDGDRFDHYCDHLLVIDVNLPKSPQIVGTCRLMDQNAALAAGGYYAESEFDLSRLMKFHPQQQFLELGRSCIAAPYRSKRTIELLWQGIWATALSRKIELLFGCASFSGTNSDDHKQAMCWLGKNAGLEEAVDCPPIVGCGVPLGISDEDGARDARTFASLPPLLKGYLRLGAKVASHAVIDYQFDTIDVLVVLNVAEISEKYIAHYGMDASRFAA